MLGKLLKHEFKFSAKTFLPLFAALLINALLVRGVTSVQSRLAESTLFSLAAMLVMFTFFALLIAVVVVVILTVLQRFYKNLYGDEGYLMMTLPVSSNQLVSSKLISATTWVILSAITAVGAVLIAVLTSDIITNINALFTKEAFQMINQYLGGKAVILIVLVLVFLLASVVESILMVYFCISVGQVIMPKKRLGGTIVAYAGLYVVKQLLMSIVTLSFDFEETIAYSENLALPVDGTMFVTLFAIMIGYSVAMSLAYFFTTSFILKRKNNLE